MSADPFVHAELPGRGRALVATRDIRAGEEVLREAPAAFVASGGSSADDCHEILAQIMIASEQERFREPIAQLVCLRERFIEIDSAMLRQVARTATPQIAALVAARCGADAAQRVGEDGVTDAFCKHALNSMTVITPEACASEVGMALYPVHGALMNHADLPNCWTMFEREDGCAKSTSLSPHSSGAVAVGMEGKRVRVQGLVKAAQYNGMEGTVQRELGDGRLLVWLKDGKELSLKPDTLIVVSDSAPQSANASLPRSTGACTYMLVVRCIAPIAAGEEITISYLDGAQSRREMHKQLLQQYFIPLPSPPCAAHGVCNLPVADVTELGRIAALDLYDAVARTPGEELDVGSLVAGVSLALSQSMQSGEWRNVLRSCEDLLYLWKHHNRFPMHPKVGTWMMTAGLVSAFCIVHAVAHATHQLLCSAPTERFHCASRGRVHMPCHTWRRGWRVRQCGNQLCVMVYSRSISVHC